MLQLHESAPPPGRCPFADLEGRPSDSTLTERPPAALSLREEAEAYVEQFHTETGSLERLPARLDEVRAAIRSTGTYQQTAEEVAYGAKLAWRNATRCIGRLHWENLTVRDERHLDTAEAVFASLLEHVRLATNRGRILPMITIFAPAAPDEPGIRIWNPQIIRYAGYRQADGSVVGDPLHVELTEVVRAMGWRGAGGRFDVLPLVIQMPRRPPRLFELPVDSILEVPIVHPDYPWFAELGLKWHALPAIANMRLDVGGVAYTAAPFNGWYVGHEIGARNLSDADRYDALPAIASGMGLDMRSNRSLWKDRALLELNRAVLHSFTGARVSIVDHHAAARQFLLHEEREARAGRNPPAEWSWIVPALSGSTVPVFHRAYANIVHKPNFFYQPDPWKAAGVAAACAPGAWMRAAAAGCAAIAPVATRSLEENDL